MAKSTWHVSAELRGLPGQCSFSSVIATLAWVALWGHLLQSPKEKAGTYRPEPAWESKRFLLPLLLHFQGSRLCL